jgi:serine phosphatase RsbU (regulator of sigma subunit)
VGKFDDVKSYKFDAKKVKKKVNHKIKQIIIGDFNRLTLEQKNYNALLFTGALISFLSFIFNIAISFNIFLNYFTSFSTLILLVLYLLSRKKSYYNIWLSAIAILFVLSVVWFMNNGVIGSIPYIFILSLIVMVLISKHHQLNRVFYIFITTIFVLYGLEYFLGEYIVVPYPSEDVYYKDMTFVFTLVFVCTYYLTRYIKVSYDEEREKVNFQKGIIEDQNNQIYSSLGYASKVQRNIISDKNDLKHLFSEYFVLFSPKDHVSGDFLWVHERDNYGIVLVADCTGHGVPAAFISILGISLLKEIIIQEKKQINAAALLEKLRVKLIDHLYDNKPGDHIEGIDLGVCVFNYPDYTLQYAGANRDLYLVRNKKLELQTPFSAIQSDEQNCLYAFKGTKNTIGYDYIKRPFGKLEIEFYTGDTFYLFSDGFPDQLNYEGKAKIGMSRFRKKMLSMQYMPLSLQGNHLVTMLQDWKGDKDQTDDILVVGVRM